MNDTYIPINSIITKPGDFCMALGALTGGDTVVEVKSERIPADREARTPEDTVVTIDVLGKNPDDFLAAAVRVAQSTKKDSLGNNDVDYDDENGIGRIMLHGTTISHLVDVYKKNGHTVPKNLNDAIHILTEGEDVGSMSPEEVRKLVSQHANNTWTAAHRAHVH